MYVLPTHLLNPDDVTVRVDRRTVSGGVALSGSEDAIETDGGGRVVVTYGNMAGDTPALERLLNAWDSYLAGGAVACLVPLVTLRTAPRLWIGGKPKPAPDFAGNDPIFPTAVGYRVRTIEAETVGDAALRATTLTIRMVRGSPVLGGEWFSIGERAHRVERVLSRDGLDYECRINPPLRVAVTDGAAVEFEWPVVKATLAIGGSLIPTLTYGLYGDVGATFVEAP
ncbi:hypothetical protein [Sphingomonas baiyangensis]|uniref:Uncharacterized protein n=1 Tax=Sphingomonas baiyangensis TaxID=2572576 RepID=A0A4U1L0G5_9SPHN|nr:hypothetical protein [Sphingomonas baiyangensis]TKD50229.1 hypothetical protein FBR43_05260 [Sphingomonas baiyangensis]